MQGSIGSSRLGGGIVYWVLVTMGLAAFTPCVLLPEWRAYQSANLEEQREAHRRDALRMEIDRQRHWLESVQRDPAVMARLAQRELGFKRTGEKTFTVDVAAETGSWNPVAIDGPPFEVTPVEPPRVIAEAVSHLPSLDYDALFCDAKTRPILMGMSIALIGLAVILFHASPVHVDERNAAGRAVS